MILLGSFFLGILVGLFIERHNLGVTSWGTNGRSCGSPSSHHSSRMGRHSRRSRSHDWRLRPSPSGVSVAHSTVPSTSLPCSSCPSSRPVSSVASVSGRPRRLKRLGRLIGFGRPNNRSTWDSTTTYRSPKNENYFGLGRRRSRRLVPAPSSTFPPSSPSSIFSPNIQPSTGVQTPIQITNLASNVTPVYTKLKVRREGMRGRIRKNKKTKAHLLFHRTRR